MKLDTSDCEEDGFGGVAAVAVNMYKLCSEVVIPATTCSEKMCRVMQSEDLVKLSAAFASENDFTLSQGTILLLRLLLLLLLLPIVYVAAVSLVVDDDLTCPGSFGYK